VNADGQVGGSRATACLLSFQPCALPLWHTAHRPHHTALLPCHRRALWRTHDHARPSFVHFSRISTCVLKGVVARKKDVRVLNDGWASAAGRRRARSRSWRA
jgi:hypothetical protein